MKFTAHRQLDCWENACEPPQYVMIGYSLTPAAKRRVWDEARKTSKVPILELHKGKGPELMPPAYFQEAQRRMISLQREEGP